MFIKLYRIRISIDNILWYDETSIFNSKNEEQYGIVFHYKLPLHENSGLEDTYWFLDKNERDKKLEELDKKNHLLKL